MSDNTPEKETGTDNIDPQQTETPVVTPEAPPPVVAEQVPEETPGETVTDPPKEDKPKPISRHQRRAAAHRAEKDRLQGRVAVLEAEKANRPAAPKVDDFESEEELDNARVDYRADERFDQREQASISSQITHAEQAERQAVAEGYNERAAEFRSRVPDFDAVVNRGTIQPPTVGEAVERSEHGPAIAYELGKEKNAGMAAEIAMMHPNDAARAIGRLEEQVAHSPPPVAQTTNAPPVTKPLSGLGSSDSIVDMKKLAKDDPQKWFRLEAERKWKLRNNG